MRSSLPYIPAFEVTFELNSGSHTRFMTAPASTGLRRSTIVVPVVRIYIYIYFAVISKDIYIYLHFVVIRETTACIQVERLTIDGSAAVLFSPFPSSPLSKVGLTCSSPLVKGTLGSIYWSPIVPAEYSQVSVTTNHCWIWHYWVAWNHNVIYRAQVLYYAPLPARFLDSHHW